MKFNREYFRPEHHPSRTNDPAYVDHPVQAKAGLSPFPDRLYVVTALSNPLRFRSRYEHYRTFEKMCTDAGAVLYTVETAFGDRRFECTEPDDPYDIQLRTYSEIWLKERMLNIGISRLPSNWQYVAWIDADVAFSRPDWAQETLHQLQHYMVVQMFSHAQDLDPNYAPIIRPVDPKDPKTISMTGSAQSYICSYLQDVPPIWRQAYYYGWPSKPLAYWHPGFCWAARREAVDALGGLFDFGIAGNGDHHMAAALIGCAHETLPKGIHQHYRNALLEWQARAEKHIQRDVGFIPGMISHHWHGKKRDRKYVERWQVLIDEKYDPLKDLKRDSQNLWQLTDRNWKLRDKMRLYMRQRQEDSIDVD